MHSRLALQDENKGIDQFLNWSMKQPPAASHMIRIPPAQVLTKEKTTLSRVAFFFGGDGGIRTLDLTDANRTLSQLSYAPVCSLVSFKHYITNFPFVKKNIDYIQNL